MAVGTIHFFSALNSNDEISFNPSTDNLSFAGLAGDFAGQLRFSVVDAPVDAATDVNDLLISVAYGPDAGKQIYLLDTQPGSFGQNNFIWEVSSLVVVGDNDSVEGTDGDSDGDGNEFFGGGGNDLLMGLGGADTIHGLGGKDYIDGGSGADSMIGGGSADTYVLGTGDVIDERAVSGGGGVDTVMTDLDWTMTAWIEKVVMTGGDNQSVTGNGLKNTITGNALINVIHGGNGDDTLIGGGGNDSLWGDAGADSMNGGDGNDVLYADIADTKIAGGAGNSDMLSLADDASGVTVHTGPAITGIEQINLTGGGNNGLELTVDELKLLSPTLDKLTVLGNAGDFVNSSGWTQTGNHLLIGGQYYDRFAQAGAVLLIDEDVTANVVDT